MSLIHTVANPTCTRLASNQPQSHCWFHLAAFYTLTKGEKIKLHGFSSIEFRQESPSKVNHEPMAPLCGQILEALLNLCPFLKIIQPVFLGKYGRIIGWHPYPLGLTPLPLLRNPVTLNYVTLFLHERIGKESTRLNICRTLAPISSTHGG